MAYSRSEVSLGGLGPIRGLTSLPISRRLVSTSSGGAGRAMAMVYRTANRGLFVCDRTRRTVVRHLLIKSGERLKSGRYRGCRLATAMSCRPANCGRGLSGNGRWSVANAATVSRFGRSGVGKAGAFRRSATLAFAISGGHARMGRR